MRTLIAAINSKYLHSSLAAACLKSYCDKYNGISEAAGDIYVREFTINDTYDSIIYGILSQKPDIVAFSCYIWNITVIRRLIYDLKKHRRELIIILGGPEVSYGMEQTGIESDMINYVIQGEGEIAFFNLLKHLNCGVKPVTGVFTGESEPCSLDELPSPYTDDFLDSCKNRILYYESSRGCPYNCSYCLSARCGGVRYLSPDRVFADIDRFINKQVKQVKFVDRTFNSNKVRAKSIIEYIIEKAGSCDINFHFEAGGDLFDESLLKLLATAPGGLIQLEVGIQSTNPETLRASSRNMPLDITFKNIQTLLSFKNINIHLDLIVGLPYETIDILARSFNDVYRLRPHQLQIGFLKLLRGSPMENMIEQYGYVFSGHAPYEIISNNYMYADDIIFLKQYEDCFNRYYNSGRFKSSLEYLEFFAASPWVLYTDLTHFLEDRSLTYKALATRELYELLLEFGSGTGADISVLGEKLLLDYYVTDQSDVVPPALRNYASYSKESKIRAAEILENRGLRPGPGNTVRFVGGKHYVFDYTGKDPVTGFYSYL